MHQHIRESRQGFIQAGQAPSSGLLPNANVAESVALCAYDTTCIEVAEVVSRV